MGKPFIAAGFIKLAKLRKKIKHIFIEALRQPQQTVKLIAVVINLHHFLHAFQTQHILVRKPSRRQHLVGLLFLIKALVIRRMLRHIRSAEHLQKSQLQLLRLQPVDIRKRPPETVIILKWQSGDQIQMLMNVSPFLNFTDDERYLFKIHFSVNFPDRIQIGGLDSDFQLDQSRSHPSKQLQLLRRDQIRRDLKMEICLLIVMLRQILPDLHRMVFSAVEGSVHKFHLRHFMIQEELQLLFHQFHGAESQPLVNRRQTVTAGKRAAAAGFIIDDTIGKILQILIGKRHLAQIHHFPPGIFMDRSVCIPPGDSRHFGQFFKKLPVFRHV